MTGRPLVSSFSMKRAVFAGFAEVAFSLSVGTFLIERPVAADSGARVAMHRFHGLEFSFFVSQALSRPGRALACRVPSLGGERACSVACHFERGGALP